MPGQSEKMERTIQGEERPKRQERAHRILDAAAELVQRWGYKKTTIDDIARQARVAKGTIYLHWKNREDLFVALFLREGLNSANEILERMENDPEGFLLRNLTKHSIAVVMRRPLIKAMYLGDIEMLGEMVHSDHKLLSQLMQSKVLASEGLFELLRSKGAMRTDMSIPTQIYVYTAIVIGFMTVEAYFPEPLLEKYALSVEASLEGLAETIRRTLEPDEPISVSTLQEVRIIFTQFYHRYISEVREQLQKEMEL